MTQSHVVPPRLRCLVNQQVVITDMSEFFELKNKGEYLSSSDEFFALVALKECGSVELIPSEDMDIFLKMEEERDEAVERAADLQATFNAIYSLVEFDRQPLARKIFEILEGDGDD